MAIISLSSCNSNRNKISDVKPPVKETIADSTDLYTSIKFIPGKTYLFPKDYRATDLTKDEINTIDSIINSVITDYNSGLKNKNPDLAIKRSKEYRKQFVSVINPQGKKLVYVNCFRGWQDFEKEWKKELIEVRDGGSNYFSLTINLSDKTYDG